MVWRFRRNAVTTLTGAQAASMQARLARLKKPEKPLQMTSLARYNWRIFPLQRVFRIQLYQ
jgi:hypothetical protein